MDQKMQDVCDKLVKYRKMLKKKMFWETDSNAVAIMSAMMCISKNVPADIDRYLECKKIFKKNVNILNEFRGISETMVITKMTFQEDPETYIQGCLKVYKKLRKIHKFTADTYMVMTAINIYENGGLEKADENIEKLEDVYKQSKAKHPFLTGTNDRPLLSLLVLSDIDFENIIDESEACYERVKKFSVLHKDQLQTMAHIMSLSAVPADDKCQKAQDIIKGLKAAKKPIAKDYGLPIVGAMALLDMPVDEIITKICEADDFLKHQKGFRWFSIGRRTRRMYDQMVVVLTYMEDSSTMASAIMNNTMTMVLMEEVMLMLFATSMAVSTINSSASSSSN